MFTFYGGTELNINLNIVIGAVKTLKLQNLKQSNINDFFKNGDWKAHAIKFYFQL